jgi:hypothetical protein
MSWRRHERFQDSRIKLLKVGFNEPILGDFFECVAFRSRVTKDEVTFALEWAEVDLLDELNGTGRAGCRGSGCCNVACFWEFRPCEESMEFLLVAQALVLVWPHTRAAEDGRHVVGEKSRMARGYSIIVTDSNSVGFIDGHEVTRPIMTPKVPYIKEDDMCFPANRCSFV